MEDSKQEQEQEQEHTGQAEIIDVPYIDPLTGKESTAPAVIVGQLVVLNPFSADKSKKVMLLMPMVEINDPIAFGTECVTAAAGYITAYRQIERLNSAPTAPRKPRPQILRAGPGTIPNIRGRRPPQQRRRR